MGTGFRNSKRRERASRHTRQIPVTENHRHRSQSRAHKDTRSSCNGALNLVIHVRDSTCPLWSKVEIHRKLRNRFWGFSKQSNRPRTIGRECGLCSDKSQYQIINPLPDRPLLDRPLLDRPLLDHCGHRHPRCQNPERASRHRQIRRGVRSAT
jgi:hypothetical protein